MACQRCKSKRIHNVSAKCSDMCNGDINGRGHEGYVPEDLGIGGGDYLKFSYCLDCGQLQNKFPFPISSIEKDLEDAVVMDFFLSHNLIPSGKKSHESFWKMVDEAKKMNQAFGSFIMNSFKTEVFGFNNNISCYNSDFNSWGNLFSDYRNYIKQ